MADPADLFNAWQDVLRQLGRAAAPVTGPSERVARQLLAPVGVALDAMDQTASAMRTQAQAFDAASQAFRQASDLLEVQAALVEQAANAMRDPMDILRQAGNVVRSRPAPRDKE